MYVQADGKRLEIKVKLCMSAAYVGSGGLRVAPTEGI